MGYGFKHGAGGASPLNFRVIGGTERPAAPRANDIWVDTGTALSGWAISPVVPEEHYEGVVWISVDTSSDVPFNALKKGVLTIFPAQVYQYIEGAFSTVDAWLYDGAAWVNFSTMATYLYLEGDTCDDITGGYISVNMKHSSTGYSQAPTVVYNEASMVMSQQYGTGAAYRCGIVRTNNKVDLSQYKTLTFEGTVTSSSTGSTKLIIWSEMGTYYNDNQVAYKILESGSEPAALDISDLTGSYYIGFALDTNNVIAQIAMTSLRLEG